MEIQKELIRWYRENRRLLIFRENKNPYSIWVSEIMAQQTRIETMLGYYERWMVKYPTIEALARAPLASVLKSWEGLGYYNRARKLHEGANYVMEVHQGVLPQTLIELEKIPGIGRYTAGAIGSIAFNLRAPAVDGNVLRVISRLIRSSEDISSLQTQKMIYNLVYDLMEEGNPSDFTQGLMELGATLCSPTTPTCGDCPIQSKCQAFQMNEVQLYPYKKPKKKPISIQCTPLLLIDEEKGIVLAEEWEDGLMKGYSRLPECRSLLMKEQSVYLATKKHVFSHRIWNMDIYYQSPYLGNLEENWQWVSFDDLAKVSIVSAHRKIIDEYRGKLFERVL